MICRLVLEDGSVWHGTAFGHTGVQGGYYFSFLIGSSSSFLFTHGVTS